MNEYIKISFLYAFCKGKKVKLALLNKSSQRYRTSLAIWDHTLSPPSDTSELTPPNPRLVLALPTTEGKKTELT